MAENLGNLFIDGESVIEDETGKTISKYGDGNLSVDTSISKVGASSIKCETGAVFERHYMGDHNDWAFYTGDYTVDLWLRTDTIAGTASVIGQWLEGHVGYQAWEIFRSGSYLQWKWYTTGQHSLNFTTSLQINTWYHVAAVRNGSSVKLYLDGVQVASGTETGSIPNLSGRPLLIGHKQDNASGTYAWWFQGNLDNVRVVKGEALWTANFDTSDNDAMFYPALPDANPNRPDTMSGLYNIGLEGNIRGKASEGFIRPTVKQFFTTDPDFEEVPSVVPITTNAVNIDFSITEPAANTRAVAFDGTNLISASYTTDLIYIHDGLTSTIQYTIPAPANFVYALHYNSETGDLLVSDNGSDDLYICDITTGFVKDSFSLGGGDSQGITMDSDGNLISCRNADSTIVIRDGVSETISSTPGYTSIPGTMGDLAWDGEHLIITTRSSGPKCYVLDGVADSVLFSFDLAGNANMGYGCVWAKNKLITAEYEADRINVHEN